MECIEENNFGYVLLKEMEEKIMSKRIYVRDLMEGYKVEDDIKSEGRILVKKGTILSSSQASRLRKWFKDADAYINISEDDCLTAASKDVNISNCINEELTQRTIDDLKVLYNASEEDFSKALGPLKDCVQEVASKIASATSLCYELDEFRALHADKREEHLFRTAKLAIALANVYNNTVPVSAEIKLTDIGLAALLHDYGKVFRDKPADVKKLKADAKLFKELNLHPQMQRLPFKMEYHSIYAYLALKDKISEKVCTTLLFSGLRNYTINKLDRHCPEARAAKIIALCHIYDELLEIVIRNKMTLPLENVISVITNGVQNGDLSKSTYKLFMDNILIYAPGTKVVLTTGEYATVVGNTSQFPTKPMVLTDNSSGLPRLLNLSETTTITIKQILSNRDGVNGQVHDIESIQLGKIVTP